MKGRPRQTQKTHPLKSPAGPPTELLVERRDHTRVTKCVDAPRSKRYELALHGRPGLTWTPRGAARPVSPRPSWVHVRVLRCARLTVGTVRPPGSRTLPIPAPHSFPPSARLPEGLVRSKACSPVYKDRHDAPETSGIHQRTARTPDGGQALPSPAGRETLAVAWPPLRRCRPWHACPSVAAPCRASLRWRGQNAAACRTRSGH